VCFGSESVHAEVTGDGDGGIEELTRLVAIAEPIPVEECSGMPVVRLSVMARA
jgi:hypothetical protein